MSEKDLAVPANGAVVEDASNFDPNLQSEAYSVFSDTSRLYLTYLLGFINVLSTLTATIYFPLIPMLSSHFAVSIQAINLTVTLYAGCQALSPPIFASLADCYGRRPVLLILIGIYACASLGLSLNTDSYGLLLGMRALQSIGGSATSAIAYGVVADVEVVSQRGSMLGPMLALCNSISTFGPVIGGAVAQNTGSYVWAFMVLFFVAAISFLFTGFTLPETSRSIVGNGSKRAHGVSRVWWPTAHLLYTRLDVSDMERGAIAPPQQSTGPKWTLKSGLHSLRIIIYPDAAAILWMIATSYTVYYTFQVAISVIFKTVYEFNDFETGLTFLPGLIGMTVGGIVAGKLVDKNFATEAQERNITFDHTQADDLKAFPIEAARYRNILIFVGLEAALITGYGWAVLHRVHPVVPLALQFFICALSTLLSHTASALLVDVFPHSSSTSYASGQVMRCGLSAASAAILSPLVDAMGNGWYFTMFAMFVGVSGLLSVSISRKKGMEWRQKRQSGGEDSS